MRSAAIPRSWSARSGAYLYDADGKEYVDYVGSWGPMILGHADAAVVAAVKSAAERGTSFGASTASEADLAEDIIAAMPSIAKLRFVSSGTEATMSAIRLARAATGRKYIVKFIGCYHGHADSLLVTGGFGGGDAGHPGLGGGARRAGAVHAGAALQFGRGDRAGVREIPWADRLRHRGAGGGQHGMRTAAVPDISTGCARSRGGKARC